MNDAVMQYQRVTTGSSFDTSGGYSGDMRATSQVHSGVYRIEGGEMTHTPYLSSDQIDIQKDGLEATAVKQSGFGRADVNDPNTLVTIGGVQAPVAFFESMGLLERDAQGKIVDTPVEAKTVSKADAQTIQENPDEVIEEFHPEVEAEVQSFVKGLHPTAYDYAMGQAIDAIAKGTGEVDIEALAKQSGKDVDATHDKMVKVLVANQVRAKSILSAEGINAQDHDDALHWAQENEPQRLSKALRQLMVNRNGNAIRQLARSYQHEKMLKSYQR